MSPDGIGLERGALYSYTPVERRGGEAYGRIHAPTPIIGYQKLKTKLLEAENELARAQRENTAPKDRLRVAEERAAPAAGLQEARTDLARMNESELGQMNRFCLTRLYWFIHAIWQCSFL